MAYSTSLGRWVQQDPAGYVDGLSLYQMEASSPVTLVDPTGLATGVVGPTTQPGGGASGGENCGCPPYAFSGDVKINFKVTGLPILNLIAREVLKKKLEKQLREIPEAGKLPPQCRIDPTWPFSQMSIDGSISGPATINPSIQTLFNKIDLNSVEVRNFKTYKVICDCGK